KHSIHFRMPKEELYWRYPRAIPAHLWYSTDPYIDEKVRQQRFNRIVLGLHNAKFDVSAWAARVIEDVEKKRAVLRVGVGASVRAQQYEDDRVSPVSPAATRELEALVSIPSMF